MHTKTLLHYLNGDAAVRIEVNRENGGGRAVGAGWGCGLRIEGRQGHCLLCYFMITCFASQKVTELVAAPEVAV